MTTKSLLSLFVSGFILFPVVCHAQKHRPNILLLFADDLGYGELGCQGNKQIPTPHIDSIAKNGIRFTAGYVSGSYCSVSRAGLMTGRYQTRFGYEFNPIGAENEDPRAGLPSSEITLAQHLHDAGYNTSLIGKWHLGGTAKHTPLRRGFDEFFGFTHEGHYYLPPPYRHATTWKRRRTLPHGGVGRWASPDGKLIYSTHIGHDEPKYDADNPILRSGQPVNEKLHLTDAFTREAVDFIDRNQANPFFLYLAYNAVHSPLQGADKYMKKFVHIKDPQRRIFAAMLSHLDDSVGEVLKKLKTTGLDKNTLVFFISDNGGPTKELTSSNLPLRGGKGSLFEGGIRVPFMCQWTGTLPAGKVETRPVISLDLFATAAALANKPLSQKVKYDSVNLLPYLTGQKKEDPHTTLFWRLNQRTALRRGDWKLLRNPSLKNRQSRWMLFNLTHDIREQNDLAKTEPSKLKEMKKVWNDLDDEMIEPVWQRKR